MTWLLWVNKRDVNDLKVFGFSNRKMVFVAFERKATREAAELLGERVGVLDNLDL